MILSETTLRKIRPVEPFVEKTIFEGKSYGLSIAGYDIRIAQDVLLGPKEFALVSSVEKFDMPNDVVGRVCDKSSWLRQGLRVGNTVIEPGWRGYLTMELFNCGSETLRIRNGTGISQILFERTDLPTTGYNGKYQDQKPEPQEYIHERSVYERD